MLHQISVMDNGMQGSWGQLGSFGSAGLSLQSAGGASGSAFTPLVPSASSGAGGKDGADMLAHVAAAELLKPQTHVAQPGAFFVSTPNLLQGHMPMTAIPVMDPSRQAVVMAQNAAIAMNPLMYQTVGLDALGWNQFSGFPQVKQEPGILGALGMHSAMPTSQCVLTPELLQMQAHFQNAQAAALCANNFVQVYDGTKVLDHQGSSENHSPDPSKYQPGARVPRWKRRNNVKHVAGERARRARTSNKVKVIRGLLPQLSANASFNDMIQMIIDIAREAAAEAPKKDEGKAGRQKTDAAVGMPVVECSDHRAMLRGCGCVASILLDGEHRIVEASAALVKNVQGDLQESRERLVGEKLATVVQPDHAQQLSEEIVRRRAALPPAPAPAEVKVKEEPKQTGEGDETEEEGEGDAAERPRVADVATHFVRRAVMCKAGPARGDQGNLKPLARMDAHVTVTHRGALIMFLSSDGVADIATDMRAVAREAPPQE